MEGLIKQRVYIDEMQCGCMSGRGTNDVISLYASYRSSTRLQTSHSTWHLFELEKDFDRVPRVVIWSPMRKLGIDKWLVRLNQSIYTDVRNRRRVGDECIEEFSVGVGVHRGSVLSQVLCIIDRDALSREFGTHCSLKLLYAVDLMINAGSVKELLVKVQTWKSEMKKRACV